MKTEQKLSEFSKCETGLRLVGGLCERARLAGTSLTKEDRKFILSIRGEAEKYFTINMQTDIEQEGARIVREALR